MGMFRKLKDVLFDIEEEEIPVIEKGNEKRFPTFQEEKPKVVEKDPIKEIKIPKDPEEDIPKPKKEQGFNFPIDLEETKPLPSLRRTAKNDDFFDEDFEPRNNYRETKRSFEQPKKKEYPDYSKYSNTPTTRPDNKPFKPTPIISPVYGILDQNYTKDDVIVKSEPTTSRNPNLDEVRKKAYGIKKEQPKKKEEEDEFTEPLKTLDELLINEAPIKEEPIKKPKAKVETLIEEPTEEIKIEDDELPDEPYSDEKRNIEEDTLETDLFNLIDSMYEERNESEEEEL